MLEADFSQQDEDERESPLQPCDHCLQLRQGRGRGGRILLDLLPGAVPLRGGCCGGLLEQGGGPVLQRMVVKVVVMMVVVVLGWTREKRSSLCAVGATFLSRRRHLDKNFRGRAQDQAGCLKLSRGDGTGGDPHQAREDLLR